ncbi:MAG: DUF2948 family protein [Pseudomonadota bacterium]
MQQLKLLALDQEDLEIMSAHLQDAVLRIEDIAYVPSDSRFAMIVNRFDWVGAGDGGKQSKKDFQRHRTALRFDRVLDAKFRQIKLSAKDAVLELLAVQFEETSKPEGHITLVFAGGGAIRLQVECIEAEMRDLGPVWKTKNLPEHEDSDDAKAET